MLLWISCYTNLDMADKTPEQIINETLAAALKGFIGPPENCDPEEAAKRFAHLKMRAAGIRDYTIGNVADRGNGQVDVEIFFPMNFIMVEVKFDA